MNTTSSITFYCRKSKANAAGLASIEVCVTICGERITSTLPRRCAPKEWCKDGVNRPELQKFVAFYTRKVEKDGWKGEFQFDVLLNSWMSRVNSHRA